MPRLRAEPPALCVADHVNWFCAYPKRKPCCYKVKQTAEGATQRHSNQHEQYARRKACERIRAKYSMDEVKVDDVSMEHPPPPPPPPPPLPAVETGFASQVPHTAPYVQVTGETSWQQGDMTQEAYRALTPGQQAAYWEQWQQYSASYYALPEEQQPYGQAHDSVLYQTEHPYPSQYEYGAQVTQGDFSSFVAQSGAEAPYLQYHLNSQQQGYHPPLPGYVGQQYAAALPQPPPPRPASMPSFQAHPLGSGGGSAMMAPSLQPKKPAVPEWLRQEMLKRVSAGADATEAKAASDSEDEGSPKRAPVRFSDAPAGSRWAKDGAHASGSEDEGEQAARDAERERMASINQEIKRNLTQILMDVTDAIFDEVAREVWMEYKERPATPTAEVVITDPDAGDSNLLGLGYGSDEEDGSRLAFDDAGQPEEAIDAKPLPAILPDSVVDAVSTEAAEEDPQALGPSWIEDGKEHATGASRNLAAEQQDVVAEPPASSFKRGERVWYIQRDNTRQAAIVVSVDITHPPPSYSVLLAGADSARETEGNRLRPMPPEDEEALRQEAEELEARAADSAGCHPTGSVGASIEDSVEMSKPDQVARPEPVPANGRAQSKTSNGSKERKKVGSRSDSRELRRQSRDQDGRKHRQRSASRTRGLKSSHRRRSRSRSRRRSKERRRRQSRSKSPNRRDRAKDRDQK